MYSFLLTLLLTLSPTTKKNYGGIPNSRNVLFVQIFLKRAEACCEAKRWKHISMLHGSAPKPPGTFSGTFSGALTWLCTKASRTFSGTFYGTRSNFNVKMYKRH